MVIIRTALPTPLSIFLREPDGWVEHGLNRDDPRAAVTLAESLARDETGASLDVSDWPVAAFDRLLLEIYLSLYGPIAECRVVCRSCTEPFEFDLQPGKIAERQDAEAAGIAAPDADGWWRVQEDFDVRAPRLSDLLATDRRNLSARISRGESTDQETADAFLELAAPVLNLDIDAQCPNCDVHQVVRFDIAAYLVTALANERAFLTRETHLLASRYGWSHQEILALNRGDRRAYAALIENERAGAQRMRRVQ
jgi:hypothetical protein